VSSPLPATRRPEFDEITMGWGGDGLDDLMARCELLAAFWVANFPLTTAEHKIARAMADRLKELGGIAPSVMQ
jgi:hypothetical protein